MKLVAVRPYYVWRPTAECTCIYDMQLLVTRCRGEAVCIVGDLHCCQCCTFGILLAVQSEALRQQLQGRLNLTGMFSTV